MNHLHGDPELVLRGRARLGKHQPIAAVGVSTEEGARIASWGCDLAADFEIGSISKGVTGMLYADAIARGEIDEGTLLGDCLAGLSSDLAQTPLRALSIHRGGLGVLPSQDSLIAASWRAWRKGENPYAGSLAQLLDKLGSERPKSPKPRYSNLGFQLLGHAVAVAAGAGYADLVERRLAEPLRLESFYVPESADQIRSTAVSGSQSGRPVPSWHGEAIGPAGGVRGSVASMVGLMSALLSGEAPGLSSLDPVAPMGRGLSIGSGWMVLEAKGRTVTWHNGGTGGFRSWMGMDRAARVGVVVLAATSRSVDRAGMVLLSEFLEQGGGAPTRQPV